MKFDESDIKAVANCRYMKRRQWYLMGGLVLVVVLMIILVLLFPEGSGWSKLAFLPFVGWIIHAALIIRGLSKFTKGLVQEWREEQR